MLNKKSFFVTSSLVSSFLFASSAMASVFDVNQARHVASNSVNKAHVMRMKKKRHKLGSLGPKTGRVLDLGYGLSFASKNGMAYKRNQFWGESMHIALAYRFSHAFGAGFGYDYLSNHKANAHASYKPVYGYLEARTPVLLGSRLFVQGGMANIQTVDTGHHFVKPYYAVGLSVPVSGKFDVRLNAQHFDTEDVHRHIMNYFVSFHYLFV